MGKHAKHEEHTNHERWIVSFADMMTLLFALFVVLYALGKVDVAKLKKVQESIKFAFNVAGSGKTKDQGLFDKQSGAGDTQLPVPLINAQDGPMKEFLHETLTQFEQAAGKSLDIVQKDDTISLRAPLSTFFALWFDRVVPLLGKLAAEPEAYTYLPSSVKRFPGPRELGAVMVASGLDDVRWILTAGGIIALHSGTVGG